jgi:2-hydroxychromene-2-carboxylate isomerase
MAEREEVKLYFDYKSPYAYLAKDPAFELPHRYRIELRWLPFLLRIKGKGERSVYSEHKARYSYMDARRWANRRGGFRIMGPLKVYDSTPALLGGLYMQTRGLFRVYTDEVFAHFFERRLEIDQPDEIAATVARLGGSAQEYLAFAAGQGRDALERCLAEAEEDRIFGVPIFVFRGEPFWGRDRIELLEERLAAAGLRL